jgi:hypothetical protein
MRFNFLNDIKPFYIQNPKLAKALFLVSFFAAIAVASPFINILLDIKPEIKDFSRHIISNGTFSDFDISARISLYYRSFAFILILAAIILFMLFKWLKKISPDNSNAVEKINLITVLSTMGLFSVAAGLFQINLDISIFFLLLLCFYLLFNINKAKHYWNTQSVLWSVFTSFPFAVCVYQLLLQKHAGILTRKFTVYDVVLPVEPRSLLFIMLLSVCSCIAVLFLKFYFRKINMPEETEQKRYVLFRSALPIMFIIPLLSILFELSNILNVRFGYVLHKPAIFIAAVTLLMFGAALVLYRKLQRSTEKVVTGKNPVKQFYYPLMLLNVTFMMSQPWRIMYPESEFFEFANHGLSVDHFFRYGMIPIVETFDAHMLNNQIFAYLYGFMNGYEPWAPFLYTAYLSIFTTITAYFVLAKITGRTKALLICLCFPFFDVIVNYYILSGITALALLNLLQSPVKRNFYVFWLSLVLLCLFRLDLGFAVTSAGISVYFLVNLITKKPLNIKQFAITGGITAGIALLLFVVLCLIKGISPINRLLEFMNVAMSNQNWTFEAMGDRSHIIFRLLYYIFPLLIFLLVAYVVLKAIVSNNHVIEARQRFAALVFFLFFSAAYLFNVPRGIVRHSYLFDNLDIVSGTMLLAFLSYIYLKHRNYNFMLLLLASFSFLLFINLKKQTVKSAYSSYLYAGVNSLSFYEKFQPAQNFNGTRALPAFSMSEINYFKGILDKLLKPHETYFDFASNNYYHAITGRKNPLYVNQTPLLLNGDTSQEQTVQLLQQTNVPLVIMPTRTNIWNIIDGIPVEFKYFTISEYIYKHYSPLIKLSSCEVYVLKDRKDIYANLLQTSKNLRKGTIQVDFSPVDPNAVPNHSLKIEKTDGKITLTPNGSDPFIYGLVDLLKVRPMLNPDLPVTVTVKIEPVASGSIQIFYQMPNQPEFTEEGSRRFALDPTVTDLVLNTAALPKDIRIDVDADKLTIEEIQFTNPDQGTETAPEAFADYNLGSIPRVWAEKADKELFDLVKPLGKVREGSSAIKDLKTGTGVKPGYLFIEMESDTVHQATVGLLNKNNNKKAGYVIATKKGLHQYAVRLSTTQSWWTNNVTRITFTSERPVKISKFAYISEDGKDIQPGVDDYLTLSNITDANWAGGVGLSYNMLLMDNSSQNAVLRAGSKIRLSDSREITVKAVRPAGVYLHVEVVENVAPFKDAAAYPNIIKVVQ